MLLLSLAAGVATAIVYTVAPLAVWAIAIGAVVIAMARRGLPPGDRRILALLLIAAIAVRVLFVVAAFGLLIPVMHSGAYATLTWFSNAGGFVLAIVLVGAEWLARGNGNAVARTRPAKVPAR